MIMTIAALSRLFFNYPIPFLAALMLFALIMGCILCPVGPQKIFPEFKICKGAEDGDLEKVRAFIKEKPDRVYKKFEGLTLLSWAARGGSKDVVKLLLDYKADVNAKDDDGQSPVWWAAAHGHKDVVELLLANNADINIKDENGFTPLNEAVRAGHKDVIELLRQHGGHE
jgi:ankyrin repeat protein